MPRIPLLFFVAVLAQAALAETPLIERNVAVSHSDLDLNKPGDARIMLARIDRAARQACGTMAERDRAYSSAPHFVTRDFSGCIERATGKAVARLRAPAVSRIYAERQPSGDVRQAAK